MVQETRNNIKKTYVYEPNSFKPVALVQDEQIYHYHLDHLGTPRELTNDNDDIVWKVRYKTYSNVAVKEVDEIENNLRFQGQYFDEESGLHYNRHRYYNPNSGQFITQDPIGLLGGINNYQYAPNPTGWVDPLGLSCKEGSKKFATQHEAAKSVSVLINPISILEDREYGGMIYQNQDETFSYTDPIKGTIDGVDPGGLDGVPSGTKPVAYYHSHGSDDPLYDNENFSKAYDPVDKTYYGDIPYADTLKIDGYLVTPKGKFKYYSHAEKKMETLGDI